MPRPNTKKARREARAAAQARRKRCTMKTIREYYIALNRAINAMDKIDTDGDYEGELYEILSELIRTIGPLKVAIPKEFKVKLPSLRELKDACFETFQERTWEDWVGILMDMKSKNNALLKAYPNGGRITPTFVRGLNSDDYTPEMGFIILPVKGCEKGW